MTELPSPLWTLASFVCFTGIVGLLTWLLTRHDDHDSSTGYFLAGRRLTGGYIAGSLLLTNLSTEQLVGLNGAAFTDGLCVMAWEVVASVSLVILALYYLPKYLKSGITTVPQFLENRFDAGTRTITTLIFLFAYAVILLPILLYTGATGLSGILNLPTSMENERAILWLTVWGIGILGSIYAIFGGLRTVAVSDTLNGFGLLVGGILIAYFGLRAVNPEGVFPALETLRDAHPEKFNSIGSTKQSVPFSTLFTGVLLLNLFYWTTNQQIIQRTFGAKNLAEGQKGVILAGVFKLLAPIILVLPGIIAFHLYSDTGMKSVDAYGTLVQNVLPPSLSGFFAAVMVGAILSSFNSALNSTATLFSLGVYKGMVDPEATEEKVVRSGKIFGTIIALVAMTLAPLLATQGGIFGYLQKMNGLYFIPIFSVMLVGMITKRVPAIAAKVALIVGFAAIAIQYFEFPLS
ncbi:UNVERIFIED_CONTAM: hypothetical protein GTU68_021392 [Idotea baltica]|nr:hypothetical protein [Idotea baltica]